MVVIVFGLPGSGKSYFAEKLAKKIGADYVNSDRLRKEMFPESTYSAEEKTAVYNVMLEKMKEALKQRNKIVLDATFHRSESRKLFTQEVKGEDRIYFIEITANENLISERLKKDRPYSEADFKVYELIRRQWEPLTEPHLVLSSTNENGDNLLQKAEECLEIKDDKRPNQ